MDKYSETIYQPVRSELSSYRAQVLENSIAVLQNRIVAYHPGPFYDIGIVTVDDERSSAHPTAESEHRKPVGSDP